MEMPAGNLGMLLAGSLWIWIELGKLGTGFGPTEETGGEFVRETCNPGGKFGLGAC